MPKPRKLSLETPTARLRLPIQKKPHWLRLGPGLSLGYRRNESAGTWSIRATDGHGGEWLKKFGVADDHEPADGKQVLSYSMAIDAARRLTRGDGEVENPSQPLTLKGALAAYEADLIARGANPYNARWPLRHLPALLLAKPIPLIEANELRRWRDSLLQASLIPAAINRVLGGVVAALNLAAAHDPRIKSRQPWHVGLQGLPDATRARNVVLSDDQVRKLISAAYDRGERFGLFVETLGVTGARPSQVSRIEVGDLRAADPAEAKLMMPRSGKGGGRLRIRKKVERISVPITAALAARLKASAAGRPSNAPLLLGRDDRGWGVEPSANYRADFRAIVAEVGLDPAEVTAYALRHSSIVRMLLAGIPVRLVASLHDTSVTEIERHYSRYISEGTHSDSLTRRALLAEEPPIAANVVALAR
jgi:integrase